MKTFVILRRSVFTFLQLVALALWVSVTHAQVGRTPGSFAVAQSGAATYTIPLSAPQGPAGLQPNVALAYNSQSGNGYVGVGWNVSGLSAIYRCNLTYAQDATSSSENVPPGVNGSAPASVTLSTSDGYCLDGQQLRLTGGTYGTAGSKYETEIANFSLVTANGTAGNGPATFTVQTRDGGTYEYGNGGNSQVPTSGTPWTWLLDKVTDRAGNTMIFTYTQATGSAVPATISWTPASHGATTYEYIMHFNYGANVPQSSIYGYVASTSVINTNLLSSITVSYAGSTVEEYDLTYQQSPTTSRYELQNIKECVNGDCLSPTTFTYQSGALGVSSSAATAATNAGDFLGVYDFDGDGRDDLLYADSQNSLWVAFGTSTGFGTPVSTGITLVNQSNRFTPAYPLTVAGDVHGSGYASILTVVNGYWWEYVWNSGSGSFSGTNTELAVDTSTEQTAALEDVNGDGLLDLITAETTSSAVTVYTRLNTTQGGALSFSSTRTTAYATTANACGNSPPTVYCWITLSTTQSNSARPIDFSGDGRGDLVLTESTESCFSQCRPGWTQLALMSGYNGFTLIPITMNSAYTGNGYFADFNNDGCTDIYAGNAIYPKHCINPADLLRRRQRTGNATARLERRCLRSS